MDVDNHLMQSSQSSMRTIEQLAGILSSRNNAVQRALDVSLKYASSNLATKKEIVVLQEKLLKSISDQKMLIKSHEATLAAMKSCNRDLRELVDDLQAMVDAHRVEADDLREELALLED